MPPTATIILVWLGALTFGILILRRGKDSADDQALRLNDRLSERVASLERSRERIERDYYTLINYVYILRGIISRLAPNEPIPPLPPRFLNGDTPTVTADNAPRIRQLLEARLSMDDLKNLAFDVAPGFSAEGYNSAGELARRLMEYVVVRGKLGDIVAWLRERRPDVKVDE